MSRKGTGRIFALDTRDGDYLLRSVTPPRRPKRRTWYLQPRLDQGQFPHCVGYAWAHFLLARPRQIGGINPVTIYAEAQKIDEWPGEGYAGTSVRAGAQYLVSLGIVEKFWWAFSAEDVLDAVGKHGPAVMGTGWPSGMRAPDHEGIVRFAGSGMGDGHAYDIIGYNEHRGLATIHNSHGPQYGINGRAYMPYEDLEQSLREAGEACMALEASRW